MLGSQKDLKFGAWRINAHPQIIEYSHPVINEIQLAAVDGYSKLPRGGVKLAVYYSELVTNIWFEYWLGGRSSAVYSSGPSFTLTPEEHEGLANQISNSNRDAGLKDLVLVGWFHSHTRSDVTLTDSDIYLHERHFPESWQIAIVLQPESSGAAHTGIFVRDRNGKLLTKPIHVTELPGKPIKQEVSEKEASIELEVTANTEPDEEKPSNHIPFSSFYQQPPPFCQRKYLTWYGIAAGILIVGTLGWAVNRWLVPPEYRQAIVHLRGGFCGYWDVVKQYWTRSDAPEPESPFSLQIAGSGSLLIIRWDPSAEPLRGSWETVLEIEDGEARIEVPITANELLMGFTTYQHRFRRH